MLRIKPVWRYRVPSYPSGRFEPWRQPAGATLLWKGASSAALLLLLESCGETGTTGPPPVRPDFLTENEARAAINQVFTSNGIGLTADVPLDVPLAPGDTATVTLDGYNDSLSVGYEYLAGADIDTFTSTVIAKMDSATADAGPYVRVVEETVDSAALARTMQDFIDTLRAHGAI